MICALITGPTYELVRKQIHKAEQSAQLLELRLDYLETVDATEIKKIRNGCKLPVIFVLRHQLQGGHYHGNRTDQEDLIDELAQLNPDYFDIDHSFSSHWIESFRCKFPQVKVIHSYHNYETTPKNLTAILDEMKKAPADYYKITTMAHSTLDALRLISWSIDRRSEGDNIIAVSMGSHGQISRIISPIVGNPFTYAALDEWNQTAPGQLTIDELLTTYGYARLNPHTQLYGLIGDPIDKSVSHITHNALFQHFEQSALYIKMELKKEELPEFFFSASRLRFKGLSVTMPLKESVGKYLNTLSDSAKVIGACNTIQWKDQKRLGFNTDAMGALQAIENVYKVKNSKVVIIGAGGAAKAIAYEALQRGAEVVVVNRDVEKAKELAIKFGCSWNSLHHMSHVYNDGYDIIINATPSPMPIESEYILSNTIAMDINTLPKRTVFLIEAEKKGCKLVYGYQMFVEQALGQFGIWFDDAFAMDDARQFLFDKLADSLQT